VNFFIALSILMLGQMDFCQAWDVNDVSMLLTLPTTLQSDALLSPDTEGSAGILLPESDLKLVPQLLASGEHVNLFVVGVRFDPCFPGVSPSGEPCHFQIRLIWQPLTEEANGVLAQDAAIHSFYELSESEFNVLLKQIATLNSSLGISVAGLPLQVSPYLQAQGYKSAYWQKLRSLLLSYTGEHRLSRITFMSQAAANEMWDFGEFDINHGKLTRGPIPRIQTRVQAFINKSEGVSEFSGGERPAPSDDPDSLTSILNLSSSLTEGDFNLLRASADSIYKIENPRLNSPETIDCASCHIAQASRIWEQRKFQNLHLDQSPFQFQSSFNLSNLSSSQDSTHLLRAFGYQGKEMAINQRVINESAAVAEKLNQLKR